MGVYDQKQKFYISEAGQVKVGVDTTPSMTNSPIESQPKAIVMVSGGLDSATVAAIAKSKGFQVIALSFDYGQRHRSELLAAKKVCESLGVNDHRLIAVDLRAVGGSALTANDIAVPKDGINTCIPVTYVPARNTIFLSLALGLAETEGAKTIFFGANALDYSGYPDCRPAFVEAFTRLANVATKATDDENEHYEIQAPLMTMTKAEIILRGTELGVDYSLTHSCYDPSEDGAACGSCDSCRLRAKGFQEAGISDPTRYA